MEDPRSASHVPSWPHDSKNGPLALLDAEALPLVDRETKRPNGAGRRPFVIVLVNPVPPSIRVNAPFNFTMIVET